MKKIIQFQPFRLVCIGGRIQRVDRYLCRGKWTMRPPRPATSADIAEAATAAAKTVAELTAELHAADRRHNDESLARLKHNPNRRTV